mgnify:CR=1 FL=1
MKTPAHVAHFSVRSYEVDPSGVLRPVVLLRMLQETAWQHASALGKGYADRSGGELFWVLSRLRMRIDSLPRWSESFSIRTQPVGVQKLFALREFELADAREQTTGRVLSAWLLVDAERGRPVRPEKLLSDIPLGEQEYEADISALPAIGGDLPADDPDRGCGVITTIDPSPVLPHHIDQYNHVNNAAYLEWVVDAIESGAPESIHPPFELAIGFLKETVLGEHFAIRLQKADGEIRADIERPPENEALARLRFRL